ncbi:hypothetical protein FB470_003432 [Amycolatopsis thermophila]|uniref:Uncharacterized protein n=1 Tax=Amycolatopsis thermophila TaxID=206084 RepID=A0ABU0EW01_9PSEU|nr:hypothetical protein [Amycolatopsis thermophila]
MGRHRLDDAGREPKWGGPALTAGARRDTPPRHARPDDEPVTQPLDSALRGEAAAL